MKTTLIRKLEYFFVAFFMLTFFVVKNDFAQSPNAPYPIIFVHGLNSSYHTWSQDGPNNDIIDFLTNAGFKPGGNLNITLDYQRTPQHLNTTITQDVHMFPVTLYAGDFYTINFDVNSNGIVSSDIPGFILAQNQVTSLFISSTDTQVGVTIPAQFSVNDIIRIDDEFMQVTGIGSTSLAVTRAIIGTQPKLHLFSAPVYNLSAQSNQASIEKQGYALKLAIDAIKLRTGAQKVIIVGHSMGGLAIREYIRSHYNNDVAKVVTIGTPHWGTDITNLPNEILSLLGGVDGRSEAVRDLRATINNYQAPYLFGGNENLITGYYSSDINYNGSENDNISGLDNFNQNPFPENIARTWIVSSYLGGGSDGVVPVNSQYIYSGDTIMTNRFHIDINKLGVHLFNGETFDYYSLLRGLDEPGEASQAYEIGENSKIKGYITFGTQRNPEDIDIYKVVVKNQGLITVKLSGNHTGVNEVDLLDNMQNTITRTLDTTKTISFPVSPNTYYIRIYGVADDSYPTYLNPYTLTTTTTATPSPNLSTSPNTSLSYYDVVLNQSINKVITLTNNGSTSVSVTNLSLTGTNANQFSITGPTTYTIAAGQSQAVTVSFNPTSAGTKNASFKITNSSTDNPIENISLQGNGAINPTKKLVINPDTSYNFGSKTITVSSAKVFSVLDTGSNKVTISNMSLIGPNANQFSISTQSNFPFDINPNGGTSQFIVNFLPTSVGVKNAKLVITNNADNKTPADTLTLYGNGTNDIYSGITGTITAYEYWFDDNYTSKVSTSINAQNLSYLSANFPTTGLTTGSHLLHIRYKDQNGAWSSVETSSFYKGTIAPSGDRKIVSYEYWFDGNYTAKVAVDVTATSNIALNNNINTASLSVGSHSMNLRYKDDVGQWSSVISNVFYKIRPTSAPNLITAYRYWFDTDNQHTTMVSLPSSVNPLVLSANLDGSNLATGNHTVHIQFKDINNSWSAVTNDTAYFHAVRSPTITSFSPANGSIGNTVTITGTNFTGATIVSFGGTAASSFKVVSPTSITAVLGSGSSGSVLVTTPDGTISQPGFIFAQSQTITFTSIPSKIYGTTDFDPGATVSSGLPISYTSSNSSVATIINGKIHIIGVGSTTITASQSGNSIFSTATSVTQTLTVTPAALTITANNQTKIYGSANPALTISYAGFVNGDTQNSLAPQPLSNTSATATSAVNTYSITVNGAASPNYMFTYVAGTLTVTPAILTITADNKSKNYGDANPALTTSYSGFVNGDTQSSLTTQPGVVTTATTASVVGTYPITLSGATATNYTVNFVAGTLTVNPAPAPTIASISPGTGIFGTTITLTGTYFLGATAVGFGGVPAASFTVNSPTSITAVVGTGASGNVTATTPTGTGTIAGFTYIFNLPPANFKLTITSATCKGSNNGSVNITATQALSYTATITGNGLNTPYPFTTTQDINNLAAGTYSVCITVAGQSAYKQCYDVVITEPKDLSLYATINGSVNTVDLALSGGDQYNINLNGVLYTTTNNTITLPLRIGKNDLTVATDKLCQGTIQKTINVSGKIVPYPDPFQETLSLNLGNDNIKNVSVEIHAVSDAKVVYSKQYTNRSGVLQLDLSGLNSGVYALKLRLDNAEQIIKILKK